MREVNEALSTVELMTRRRLAKYARLGLVLAFLPGGAVVQARPRVKQIHTAKPVILNVEKLLRELEASLPIPAPHSGAAIGALGLASVGASTAQSGGGDYFGAPAHALMASPSLGSLPPENAPLSDPLAAVSIGSSDEEAAQTTGTSATGNSWGDVMGSIGGAANCLPSPKAWSGTAYWAAQGTATMSSARTTMVDSAIIAAADQTLPPGPAGGWCRPGNEPFAGSSPLASGSFWTFVAVIVIGGSALLSTRGWRMPA